MGGSAFSQGAHPLYTPRMSADVYKYVRDNCHSLLRKWFLVVASPIEGPGKSDFGDIDIFATWRRPDTQTRTALGVEDRYPFDAIQNLLGATRYNRENDNFAIFAVPWPKELAAEQQQPEEERFIQVDVHICPTLENLQWQLFHDAHGDLWNILGHTIRPFGLLVDDVGLHLRIPEIEKLDKKRSRVLLSREPCEVLDFLGLRHGGSEWEQSLASPESLYEYAASCRFFQAGPPGVAATADGSAAVAAAKPNSGARRRLNLRPVFRHWIEEFEPRLRRAGRFVHAPVTREQTRDQALRQFGCQFAYKQQLLDFLRERQSQALWNGVIKPAVPLELDPAWRACACKALKKIVMEDDDTFGHLPAVELRDENEMYREDEVRHYVETSWEDVGKVAWAMNQTRFQASL
jgi:hypothetical protein